MKDIYQDSKAILRQFPWACILMLVLLFSSTQSILSQQKATHIELQFIATDSAKYITAQVNEKLGDSIGAPAAYIDLFFFVERSFSLLPIGGVFNTTDENGKVKIEFPSDLPGDEAGNVGLVIKLEEAEEFRDTVIHRTLAWGIPISIDRSEEKRSLWAASANAPISLILLVNSILLVVWGLIFYILYQLYLIRKE